VKKCADSPKNATAVLALVDGARAVLGGAGAEACTAKLFLR